MSQQVKNQNLRYTLRYSTGYKLEADQLLSPASSNISYEAAFFALVHRARTHRMQVENSVPRRMYRRENFYDEVIKPELICVYQVPRRSRGRSSVLPSESSIVLAAVDLDDVARNQTGDARSDIFNDHIKEFQSREFLGEFPNFLYAERTVSGIRMYFRYNHVYDWPMYNKDAYDRLEDLLSDHMQDIQRNMIWPKLREYFTGIYLQKRYGVNIMDYIDTAAVEIDRAFIVYGYGTGDDDLSFFNHDCVAEDYIPSEWFENKFEILKGNKLPPLTVRTTKSRSVHCVLSDDFLSDIQNVAYHLQGYGGKVTYSSDSWGDSDEYDGSGYYDEYGEFHRSFDLEPRHSGHNTPVMINRSDLRDPYIDFGEGFITSSGKDLTGASAYEKFVYAVFAFATCHVPLDTMVSLFMLVPGYDSEEHRRGTWNMCRHVIKSYNAMKEPPNPMLGTVIRFLRALNFPVKMTKSSFSYELKQYKKTIREIERYVSEDSDFVYERLMSGDAKTLFVQSQTGSGKTTLSFDLVKRMYLDMAYGRHPVCVFIVPYRMLVAEMCDKAEQQGVVPVMLLKDFEDRRNVYGRFNPLNFYSKFKEFDSTPHLIITTYDTYKYKIMGKMSIDLMIVDEVHVIFKEANFRGRVLNSVFNSILDTADSGSMEIDDVKIMPAEPIADTKFMLLSATIPFELPTVMETMGVKSDFIQYIPNNTVESIFYVSTFTGSRVKGLFYKIAQHIHSARAYYGYPVPTIIHNNDRVENIELQFYLQINNIECVRADSDSWKEDLKMFTSGSVPVLITTDVAIAGYDLKGPTFDGKECAVYLIDSRKNGRLNPETAAQIYGRFRNAKAVDIIRFVSAQTQLEPDIGDEGFGRALRMYHNNKFAVSVATLSSVMLSAESEKYVSSKLMDEQLKDYVKAEDASDADFDSEIDYSQDVDMDYRNNFRIATGSYTSVEDSKVYIQICSVVHKSIEKRNKIAGMAELSAMLTHYISKCEINDIEGEESSYRMLGADSQDGEDSWHSPVVSPDEIVRMSTHFEPYVEEFLSVLQTSDYMIIGGIKERAQSSMLHSDRVFFSRLANDMDVLANESKGRTDLVDIDPSDYRLRVDGWRCDNSLSGSFFDEALKYVRASLVRDFNFFVKKIPSYWWKGDAKSFAKRTKKSLAVFRLLVSYGFLEVTKCKYRPCTSRKVAGRQLYSYRDDFVFTEKFNKFVGSILKKKIESGSNFLLDLLSWINTNVLSVLEERFFNKDSRQGGRLSLKPLIKLASRLREPFSDGNSLRFLKNLFNADDFSEIGKSFQFQVMCSLVGKGQEQDRVNALMSGKDLSKTLYTKLYNLMKYLKKKAGAKDYSEGFSVVMSVQQLGEFFGRKWSKYTSIAAIRKHTDYLGKLSRAESKNLEEPLFRINFVGRNHLGVDELLSQLPPHAFATAV